MYLFILILLFAMFLVWLYSLLSSAQKVSRCILKVFSPEVYTASFGEDVRCKAVGPGGPGSIASCLLQVPGSHHCSKPHPQTTGEMVWQLP